MTITFTEVNGPLAIRNGVIQTPSDLTTTDAYVFDLPASVGFRFAAGSGTPAGLTEVLTFEGGFNIAAGQEIDGAGALTISTAASGDLTLDSANDVVLPLADAAGARKLIVKDSGDNTKFTVSSVGDVLVARNLTVQGTMFTTHTEEVVVGDNYLYLNAGYTTDTAITSGLVVNYDPTTTQTTTTGAGVFTRGEDTAGGTGPTVTTEAGSGGTFSQGDIIQVSGSTSNDGIYEVQDGASTTLEIRGVDGTGTVEDFSQNNFTNETDTTATITKVAVSVMRAGTDGAWYVGNGSTTGFTYNALATAAGATLQSAYQAGNTIGMTDGDGNFDVSVTSGTPAISLDAAGNSNFTVDSANLVLSTTTSGELDLTSAGLMDLNAGANLDIDVTGTFDMLASSTFSIAGTGASAITANSGNLAIGTATSGSLLLTTVGAGTFTVPDNTSEALKIAAASDATYWSFNTTNAGEAFTLHNSDVLWSADDGGNIGTATANRPTNIWATTLIKAGAGVEIHGDTHIINTTNQTGSTDSDDLTIRSGTVVDGTSGDVIIDSGAESGSGTAGGVTVAATNAPTVAIGRDGVTTTLYDNVRLAKDNAGYFSPGASDHGGFLYYSSSPFGMGLLTVKGNDGDAAGVGMASGNVTGANDSGYGFIQTGTVESGASGDIQLSTGAASVAGGTSGQFLAESGNITAGSGDSGFCGMNSGAVIDGTSGAAWVNTGVVNGTSGASGDVRVFTGSAGTGVDGPSTGDLWLYTGSLDGTATGGTVGNINIQAGNAQGQTQGQINIGTTNAAILQIGGTTTAPRIANMTTTQRNALTPTDGMIIFNSTTGTFQIRYGSAWNDIAVGTGTGTLQTAYDNGDTITITTGNPVEMIVPNAATGPALRIDNENAAGGVGLVLGDDTSIQYGESSYTTTYVTGSPDSLTTVASAQASAGDVGAAIAWTAQQGGDGSSGAGSAGGAITLTTGTGGGGDTDQAGGAGGALTIAAGTGGAGNGAGNGGAGGALSIDSGAGGTGAASGAAGALTIAPTNATAVGIGNSGGTATTTTVYGKEIVDTSITSGAALTVDINAAPAAAAEIDAISITTSAIDLDTADDTLIAFPIDFSNVTASHADSTVIGTYYNLPTGQTGTVFGSVTPAQIVHFYGTPATPSGITIGANASNNLEFNAVGSEVVVFNANTSHPEQVNAYFGDSNEALIKYDVTTDTGFIIANNAPTAGPALHIETADRNSGAASSNAVRINTGTIQGTATGDSALIQIHTGDIDNGDGDSGKVAIDVGSVGGAGSTGNIEIGANSGSYGAPSAIHLGQAGMTTDTTGSSSWNLNKVNWTMPAGVAGAITFADTAGTLLTLNTDTSGIPVKRMTFENDVFLAFGSAAGALISRISTAGPFGTDLFFFKSQEEGLAFDFGTADASTADTATGGFSISTGEATGTGTDSGSGTLSFDTGDSTNGTTGNIEMDVGVGGVANGHIEIGVTNADYVALADEIRIGDAKVILEGDGLRLTASQNYAPVMGKLSTAQRTALTAVGGMLIYNTDNDVLEYYDADATAWTTLASGGAVTLQGAYDGGDTIQITSGNPIEFTVGTGDTGPALQVSNVDGGAGTLYTDNTTLQFGTSGTERIQMSLDPTGDGTFKIEESSTGIGAANSTAISIASGNVATGASGNISLATGNASGAGTSGNLTFDVGTHVGGTAGTIGIGTTNPATAINIGNGTVGNSTWNMGSSVVTWTAATVIHAGDVRINDDEYLQLGSGSDFGIRYDEASNDRLEIAGLLTGIGAGNTSGMILSTGGVATGASGDIVLNTGSASGAGSPGKIELDVGTHVSGTNGTISLGFNNPATLKVGGTTCAPEMANMTTVQRDALPAAANGMIIFNSTTGTFQIYYGAAWNDIAVGTGTGTLQTAYDNGDTIEVTSGNPVEMNVLTGRTGPALSITNVDGGVGLLLGDDTSIQYGTSSYLTTYDTDTTPDRLVTEASAQASDDAEGAAIVFTGQQGGNNSGATVPGSGGDITISGGATGDADSSASGGPPAEGGALRLNGGDAGNSASTTRLTMGGGPVIATGGSGSDFTGASGSGGVGGEVRLTGGSGGDSGGAVFPSGAGGSITIDGGAPGSGTVQGNPGTVSIAPTNSTNVNVGNNSANITINGSSTSSNAIRLQSGGATYLAINGSTDNIDISQRTVVEDDVLFEFGSGSDASINYDENGNDRLQFAGADVELNSNLVFGATASYNIGSAANDATDGFRPEYIYANNIVQAGTGVIMDGPNHRIQTSDGSTPSQFFIRGGNNTGSGAGAKLSLSGGTGTATGAGGDLELDAGASGGAAGAGNIEIGKNAGVRTIHNINQRILDSNRITWGTADDIEMEIAANGSNHFLNFKTLAPAANLVRFEDDVTVGFGGNGTGAWDYHMVFNTTGGPSSEGALDFSTISAADDETRGAAIVMSAQPGGDSAGGAAGGIGGLIDIEAGNGGMSDGSFPAGTGGNLVINGGIGGDGDTAVAGANGGQVQITGGTGGNPGASSNGGGGGQVSVFGGNAGGTNGGGGNVAIDGGQPNGTGKAGDVVLAGSYADVVRIGGPSNAAYVAGPANGTGLVFGEVGGAGTGSAFQLQGFSTGQLTSNLTGAAGMLAYVTDGTLQYHNGSGWQTLGTTTGTNLQAAYNAGRAIIIGGNNTPVDISVPNGTTGAALAIDNQTTTTGGPGITMADDTSIVFGDGSDASILWNTDGTTARLQFLGDPVEFNQNLVFGGDSYDIGSSADDATNGYRPRTIYTDTSVVVGATTTLTTDSLTASGKLDVTIGATGSAWTVPDNDSAALAYKRASTTMATWDTTTGAAGLVFEDNTPVFFGGSKNGYALYASSITSVLFGSPNSSAAATTDVTVATGDGTGFVSGDVVVKSGNGTGSATGNVHIWSGRTTTSGNSGNVLMDVGTAAGTNGSILIGTQSTGSFGTPTGITVGQTATPVTINTSTLDVNSTAAIALDSTAGALSLGAAASSDFTVTGGDLLLNTLTSGDVTARAAGVLNLETLDQGSSSSGNISIQTGTAAGTTVVSGDVDIRTGDVSGSGNTVGDIDIDTGEATTSATQGSVNIGTTYAGAVNIATTGVVTTVGGNLDVDGTTLNLGGAVLFDNGTSALILGNGTDYAPQVPQLTTAQRTGLTGTDGMIVYDSQEGDFYVYDSGWKVMATGGSVDLNTAYNNGNTITTDGTGNVIITGTQALQVTATGGIDLDTVFDADVTVFDVQMTGDNGFSIDGTEASNISVATDDADENLTLSVTGATASSLILTSEGTGTDAIDINATNAAGGIDIDAGATSGVVTINSGGATTITSGGINLAAGSSEIDLTTTGALDLNSGAGTWDASTLSLDSTDDSNLTMTANDAADKTLTIRADNGGAGDGLLLLQSTATAATAIKLEATTGGVNVDSAGVIDLDGGGAVSINSDGGAINIGDDANAQAVNIATGAAARIITIGNAASASMALDAGVGGLTAQADTTIDIDAGGALSLNSSGGAINIGDDDVAQAINIGTDAARTITIGSGDATEVEVNGDLVDINSDGGVTIDGATASNFTVTGSGESLTLEAAGGGAQQVLVQSAGTGDDAIKLNASAGGIEMEVASGDTINAKSFIEMDQDAGAGLVIDSGAAITANRVLTIDSSGTVQHADANVNSLSVNLVGIAQNAVGGSGNPVRVHSVTGQRVTVYISTTATNYARGDVVYLSTTAGEATVDAPSASGDRVFQVGILLTNANAGSGAGTETVVFQPRFVADIP